MIKYDNEKVSRTIKLILNFRRLSIVLCSHDLVATNAIGYIFALTVIL